MSRSRQMSLFDLLTALGEKPMSAYNEIILNGIDLDSRKITIGNLFVAVSGTQTDGGCFIQAAIDNQAAAVIYDSSQIHLSAQIYPVPVIGIQQLQQRLAQIADHWYQAPSASLKLIAITGTNGKTTCAHLIAQALEYLGLPTAIIGTAGQGRVGKLQTCPLTTPDVFELRRLLAKFVADDVQAVVLEASSHGLEQGRLKDLSIYCAVFTNLSHDHLDYHKDEMAYTQAKLKLFNMPGLKVAVMNNDQPIIKDYKQHISAEKILSYGASKNSDVRLVNAQAVSRGLNVELMTTNGRFSFSSLLVGKINLENLLAVFTSLLALGYIETAVSNLMPKLHCVPGRMEVFGGSAAMPMVVVDYAHTPDALEKALVSLHDHVDGKLICVFGCGGDRDKAKRPKMGAAAQKYADLIVLTDDNPRHETSAQIISDILAGMSIEPTVISDRPSAIHWAIQQAASNDVVLIAGKGHETTQQIGDAFLKMSDRTIVAELLEAAA